MNSKQRAQFKKRQLKECKELIESFFVELNELGVDKALIKSNQDYINILRENKLLAAENQKLKLRILEKE